MTLYLFRGLPGSGKSTAAQDLCNIVFSADDFFYVDGQYSFDPKKIREAHAYCLQRTEAAIQQREQRIGVANTFTQEWEIAPYYQLAQRYNTRVVSLIVENRHAGFNIHGVPDEVIVKMRSRFQVQL